MEQAPEAALNPPLRSARNPAQTGCLAGFAAAELRPL
jgi:hypothetical protein